MWISWIVNIIYIYIYMWYYMMLLDVIIVFRVILLGDLHGTSVLFLFAMLDACPWGQWDIEAFHAFHRNFWSRSLPIWRIVQSIARLAMYLEHEFPCWIQRILLLRLGWSESFNFLGEKDSSKHWKLCNCHGSTYREAVYFIQLGKVHTTESFWSKVFANVLPGCHDITLCIFMPFRSSIPILVTFVTQNPPWSAQLISTDLNSQSPLANSNPACEKRDFIEWKCPQPPWSATDSAPRHCWSESGLIRPDLFQSFSITFVVWVHDPSRLCVCVFYKYLVVGCIAALATGYTAADPRFAKIAEYPLALGILE